MLTKTQRSHVDRSALRPSISNSPSFTSTTDEAVWGSDEWGNRVRKLVALSPKVLVSSDGVSTPPVMKTTTKTRHYAHTRVPQRTASEYLNSSHKPSQDYFNSARPLHGVSTKLRKDSWIDRKLHPRRYKKYLEGNEIKEKVIAGGLARPDIVEDFEAISELVPTRLPRFFPRRTCGSSSSEDERSRLHKEKSVNDKDVFSKIKSTGTRLKRRLVEGRRRPRSECPSVVPIKTSRWELDGSSDDGEKYHDANPIRRLSSVRSQASSYKSTTSRQSPYNSIIPSPTPLPRSVPINHSIEKDTCPDPFGHLSGKGSTLSDEKYVVRPHQKRSLIPPSPPSHPLSPSPTLAETRSRIAEWASKLFSETTFDDDGSTLAGSLGSGLSRTSTLREERVSSSVAYPNKDPSPWELRIAASMTGGSRNISRQDTRVSGTTLGTSPVSERSSNIPWASGRKARKNDISSKYVLRVRKSPSEYSLDSLGKIPTVTERFEMLDTRLPMQNQSGRMRSMVAA